MKKNEFEEEWAEYKALCDEFDAIDAATDNDGDLDPVRDKMHELNKRIGAKGQDYVTIFKAYKDMKIKENNYIDFGEDVIWSEYVSGLTEALREYGIDYFTFSSTWSDAINTAWLFTQEGCSLEGLIQINGREDWRTRKPEKKPAYLFKVN